jgi:uncharacterized protein YggE
MGQVKVIGVAKAEQPSDQCRIEIGFEITRDTASEASRATSEHCEKLLRKLSEIGIDPKEIENDFDRLDRRNEYKSESAIYQTSRTLRFSTDADMTIVNAIRDVVEEEFEEAVYEFTFETTKEPELNRELTRKAIEDSREKAELLAQSMGCRIVGVESANLSGDEDMYDAVDGPCRHVVERRIGEESSHPLSDDLRPAMVELSQRVNIVWLVDPVESGRAKAQGSLQDEGADGYQDR